VHQAAGRLAMPWVAGLGGHLASPVGRNRDAVKRGLAWLLASTGWLERLQRPVAQRLSGAGRTEARGPSPEPDPALRWGHPNEDWPPKQGPAPAIKTGAKTPAACLMLRN